MTNLRGVRVLQLLTISAAMAFWSACFGQDATSSGLSGGSSTGTDSTTGASGATTGTATSVSTSSNTGPDLAGGAQTTRTGLYSKLPFQLNFSLDEGYDDNANNASSGKQGSAFTSGKVDLNYGFGDPRVQLSLKAGASGTYYYESLAVQNYDIDLHGGLDLVYEASPRLTLRPKLYIAYLTEPDFSFGYGVNRRTGNYFLTADEFRADYEWLPRFSTSTSYSFVGLNYDSRSTGQFEDRVENTFGNEFRFLLVPTTTLVVEWRYQIITYHYIGSDSTTHYVLGGIDHQFAPRFSGSLRVGAEFRDYDQDGNRTEPYVEGTLNYAAGKRSSLAWTIRYGLQEPYVAQIPSRKTFNTGLQIRQELMPRLSGQLAFYYQHDDNEGVNSPPLVVPSFAEDSVDIQLSARYLVTHYLAIEGGYGHTQVFSDISFREYDRNRVYGGVNIAF